MKIMATSSSTLLRGGRVLIFDREKKATFPVLDVLIQGTTIAKVEPYIVAGPDTKVIDATGKLICPGFVDSHRHLFQSHIRTSVADQTLLEYCGHLLLGRVVYYKPHDTYLAQLGAATEAIHCGVTTVLDHSHIQLSEEHIQQCIKASIDSGVRSIYCFALYGMPESINPLKFADKPDVSHQNQIDLFYKLSKQSPLGNSTNDGRVTLGLGYDGIEYHSVEDSKKLLEYAHNQKYAISFHDVNRHGIRPMKFLREHNLLSETMVFSHLTFPAEGDFAAAKAHGIGISCTAESEMQMAHGWPEAFPAMRHGCKTGLGVDSSAICSGDMFAAMRICLQTQRARDNHDLAVRNKIPKRLQATVDQALYMATLGGAEAIHMESEIGSIEVGKKADVTIISTDSPCMVAASNPAAALVLHASPADIESVIVNGEVVKENGKLLKVDWSILKHELLENKKELEERWKDADWSHNTDELAAMWHMTDKLE
jgi:cytosine/adenosine deaminase-related metal-dependent hydrolase